MNNPALRSQKDAERVIARLFVTGNKFGKCRITVKEPDAFKNGGMRVGEVSLQHSNDKQSLESVESLIGQGAFEWVVPSFEDTRRELMSLLTGSKKPVTSFGAERIMRATSEVFVRAGLLHPIFDPQDIAEMPMGSSTSVVSDTSGVISGALDFVVRHFPEVRVKVPAIVHMEIVNLANRFRSLQRDTRRQPDKARLAQLVIEHMKSQGAHRDLLRLELHSTTEVERTFLLGDPLRSAFQRDNDGDVQGLNLNRVQREYADRLILESARHHQAQSGPNHKVRLLTSDQALANMSFAEGVRPVFFRPFPPVEFFGQRLTGQIFDPFSGYLNRISLTSILWELAVAFGEVSIAGSNQNWLTIVSSVDDRPWSTFRVTKDLQWCKDNLIHETTSTVLSDQSYKRSSTGNLSEITYQRFNVNHLVKVIFWLGVKFKMSQLEIMNVVKTESFRGVEEIRRFLLAAGLIKVKRTGWVATDHIKSMSAALRNGSVVRFRQLLWQASASFRTYAEILDSLPIGSPVDGSTFRRGYKTFGVLGEVMLLNATVHSRGIFPTPNNPGIRDFAEIAINRFLELKHDSELVPTGAWLESLIQNDGIHPEIARRCLDEASQDNLLRRSTEGSTTQYRNSDHVINVLRVSAGSPSIQVVHLYRGDYLVEGKGSVSIRIERPGR